MHDIQIYNCHTHLFTLRHIPQKAFGFLYSVKWLLKFAWVRTLAMLALWVIGIFFHRVADDWSKKLQRLTAFLKIGEQSSQLDIFEKVLKHYYPEKTRIVVLPMDFSLMGYGAPEIGIDEQLAELEVLAGKYPERIIPFVHIDPRNPRATEIIRHWVVEKKFRGVKIYPPFGYSPNEHHLTPIYAFCEQHDAGKGIPIMTHCSGAVLRARDFHNKPDQASDLCAPKKYQRVLQTHPGLRLCLGHCGGDSAWDAYLNKPLPGDRRPKQGAITQNWLDDILDMLQSGRYPGLYVDISYVIFHFHENANILKVLLENPDIRSKVIFGTDFYMAELEKFSEKRLSMYLRATIGEENFREIAEINPQRYLFGSEY